MNKEVQAKIAVLEQKGWTLINIGRELGLQAVTIESWKAGTRSPASSKLVLDKLTELEKRTRIPPQKVYQPGARRKHD